MHEFLDLLDADGDGRSDILTYGGYLHLSSSGKDVRTRPFDGSDADRHFLGYWSSPFVLGPLNDSAGHYDMFALSGGAGDAKMLAFSGGEGGPDFAYDATYSTGTDGLGSGHHLSVYMPAGDIDGNGWRDHIAGNQDFAEDLGIAIVIGGGPYIPRDSMPASAIRDIAADGRDAAISVWPIPAADVLHIAWRGNLHRTPVRFIVHDLLGRIVARGDATPSRGEVLWDCTAQPPGLYLLSIHDGHGGLITTISVPIH